MYDVLPAPIVYDVPLMKLVIMSSTPSVMNAIAAASEIIEEPPTSFAIAPIPNLIAPDMYVPLPIAVVAKSLSSAYLITPAAAKVAYDGARLVTPLLKLLKSAMYNYWREKK